MRVVECKQGSPEWYRVRAGVPTASEFGRLLTPKRLQFSEAGARSYACELIAARLLGGVPENVEAYASRAMEYGSLTEPEARAFYALDRDCDVQQVGFCLSDDGKIGCSPDGLVGDDGGLELKCPQMKTHVGYLLDGALPDAYKAQVHGSLIVTGRKWWDFLSYAVGAPPLLVRVEPDEYTDALREAVEKFHPIYEQMWQTIAALLPEPEPVDESLILF